MSAPATTAPRLGFQTKVLIPVLVCLVALPVVTGVIVADYFKRQQTDSVTADLATAQRVFETSLQDRARDLRLEFRPAAEKVAPIAVLLASGSSLASARKTMSAALVDQLAELGAQCQIIAYSAATPQTITVTQHQLHESDNTGGARPLTYSDAQFVAAARPITEQALEQGDEASGIVAINGGAFYVAAIAVTSPDGQRPGALTFGHRLDDSTAQDLKSITNAEIILFGDQGVIASTLRVNAVPAVGPQLVTLGGVHYLARTGSYGETGPHLGFKYVLLLNFEESLRIQGDMARLLALVSIAGIALSALAVWWFTRRSMRPLRELRDTAEAVGRGDFSRRLERFPNDECGDLATAFNGMTTNLQSSRAELQKTVDTLRATQTQLIQSEKLSAVGQFVSGVAHELNNPLAAVIGFSELLEATATDETIRPHLELIVKSAQRCHKIVQNLLGFARQHPPERKLVQVNAAVEEVLEFMAYELRTGNITIVRQLGDGLPATMADTHQLQQVFVNILGNARQAIQAFRPDGRIIVRTREIEGGMIRIEFMDNGPGIRPENLSRIFDPFFTTKPVGKGTGLGLSLSYGIIQEHGGQIRAESVVGHGATFIIDLPVTAEAGGRREAAVRKAAPVVNASKSGKAVLVVDDEVWLLTLVRQLLEQQGHEAVTARSGEEAIAALGQRRFDLIVCDWKMPGLSGAPFYEHLAAIDPASADRIIFMSGDVMNDALQDFIARHNKVCLPKPFPIAEFQALVASQLERPAGAPAK